MLPTIASRRALALFVHLSSSLHTWFLAVLRRLSVRVQFNDVRLVERRIPARFSAPVRESLLLNCNGYRSLRGLDCVKESKVARRSIKPEPPDSPHCVVETGAEFHPRAPTSIDFWSTGWVPEAVRSMCAMASMDRLPGCGVGS